MNVLGYTVIDTADLELLKEKIRKSELSAALNQAKLENMKVALEKEQNKVHTDIGTVICSENINLLTSTLGLNLLEPLTKGQLVKAAFPPTPLNKLKSKIISNAKATKDDSLQSATAADIVTLITNGQLVKAHISLGYLAANKMKEVKESRESKKNK